MTDLSRIARFKSPGPIASAFLADRTSAVRMLAGPVGGGKSVTCAFDGLANATQMPICRDGVIRSRGAVIGLTYGQIERNLYPTWFQWVPRDGGDWSEGDWTGGGGRFGRHVVRTNTLRDGRKVPLELEVIFAAFGEQAVEQFMRGFEPTWFWLYEADLMPEAVLTNAISRLGRYPGQVMLEPGTEFRSYIVGDLNMPDIDSWFYRTFEEQRPAGMRLYRQPSGRSAQAENIANLPKGYYTRQVELNRHKPHWIRRFVDAEYGPSLDGEPVYPEYSDATHFAADAFAPLKGVPIKLGLDAGLQRPAAILGQRAPSGQFRIGLEVVPGRVGAHRFADAIKRGLAEWAPHHEVECGFVDPWGFTGADKEGGQLAWAESVAEALGVPLMPAPSNELGLRLDAVRDELTYMIDAHTPALLISRACPMLRKGFASHYRYQRVRVGVAERTADKPEKNEWSDPQDALQYLLLGEKGRYGVIRDPRAGREPGRDKAAASDRHDRGGNTVLRNGTRFW